MLGNLSRYAACFIAGAVVVSAGHAATPYLSAKGTFATSFMEALSYDPSKACRKPYRPLSGADKFAWDSYQRDGEQYLTCIKAASVADVDFATAAISEGYGKAVSDFLREVKGGY